MDVDWQAALSALAGGLGVGGIAKHYLTQSAQKLDLIPEKLGEIKAEIAAINVHLSDLHSIKKSIQEHDREIAQLKGRASL